MWRARAGVVSAVKHLGVAVDVTRQLDSAVARRRRSASASAFGTAAPAITKLWTNRVYFLASPLRDRITPLTAEVDTRQVRRAGATRGAQSQQRHARPTRLAVAL
jgi:hypothetical protein